MSNNLFSNVFVSNKVIAAMAGICLLTSIPSLAVTTTSLNPWYDSSQQGFNKTENSLSSIGNIGAKAVITADFEKLTQSTKGTLDHIIMAIPLPDGRLVDFKLTPSLVVAPELAARYPEIKTYSGVQVDNPEHTGRFDITPKGFHGMFRFNGDTVFIEPNNQNTVNQYKSYFRKDALKANTDNFTQQAPKKYAAFDSFNQTSNSLKDTLTINGNSLATATSKMRTYRIAISAVGEYTAFHGGTKDSALAELVTLVNRLNDVYQRDLSIKLELVANNDEIIYTDAASDPFNNDSNDGSLNTAVIDAAIGNANYDIGHVVVTSGGGLARWRGACATGIKGDGLTGLANPVNDAFYIDYVAHEVGHQFGADHTFNASEGACDGNRETSSAYEPGSASTIMGYAGICGSQNLQNNSDPYFAAHTLDQVKDFQNSEPTCGTDSTSVNNVPVANAGVDYTIPANTPFVLTGSATDSDNDSLNYSWEQFDLGTASSSLAEMVDDGSRPLFRVFNPVTEPVRTFPKMADVLSGTVQKGENYATTNRDLNFRLLARDNNGGVGSDLTKLTVIDTGEAFSITQPTAWTEAQTTINWNVAGTTAAPINCSNVNILLSTDSGISFTQTLASAVPNNGSYQASLSSTQSTKSRIKIACSDNIFFAVNESDFSISVVVGPVISGQESITLIENSSLTITPSMFTYDGSAATSLEIVTGSNYTVSGTTITPTTNFVGALNVGIIGIENGVKGSVFNSAVNVTALEVPEISGQNEITTTEDQSITLTTAMFTYAGVAAESIQILAGENYSVSDTTVTPNTGFSGILTVGVIALANTKESVTFNAEITVTAKPAPAPTPSPTPTPNTSSSGGAMFWSIGMLIVCALRRRFSK